MDFISLLYLILQDYILLFCNYILCTYNFYFLSKFYNNAQFKQIRAPCIFEHWRTCCKNREWCVLGNFSLIFFIWLEYRQMKVIRSNTLMIREINFHYIYYNKSLVCSWDQVRKKGILQNVEFTKERLHLFICLFEKKSNFSNLFCSGFISNHSSITAFSFNFFLYFIWDVT